ncbi:hypothetical protein PF003_g15887 [Phytophthora fragariae]|nr:hypothetical protein PF003_g15887 [Phytophthora fragariae]
MEPSSRCDRSDTRQNRDLLARNRGGGALLEENAPIGQKTGGEGRDALPPE